MNVGCRKQLNSSGKGPSYQCDMAFEYENINSFGLLRILVSVYMLHTNITLYYNTTILQ